MAFTIDARDGSARAGVLRTKHGDVRTPAFVPLASTGTVKSLSASEVAGLGFEMVLGNTFHLFIQPGHEHVRKMGGLHEFMGWDGAIITDSGGFQVFSMGHGSVAEEVKRRAPERRDPSHGGVISIEEEGVRFRSYLDGSERFMGPETSMEVQAALGSDVALAFDECTPFNVTREYTARSTERTHRWLDRCIAWHAENAPDWQLFFGIVQGGVHEDLRRESAERVASAAVDGVAIGGSLGEGKDDMKAVVDMTVPLLPDQLPRHLLGIGDVDDLIHGVGAGIDLFDCATPTRLARHGTALVPDPESRWRLDLGKPAHAESQEPIAAGCLLPRLRRAHAGLHPLPGQGEGADGRQVAHAPQPHLHATSHAEAARSRGPRAFGRGIAGAARDGPIRHITQESSTTFVERFTNASATPVYLTDMAVTVQGTPKHFMNVGQAAEYLGVSAASLRNWSDQGKVPVYRTPGGQRRYRVSDLDRFIESWRETPAAQAE